jgi:DNA polymerase-3 subunit gamma/tau
VEPRQHRSLYRKYRPQSPDQIIGQDHVVRALVGAIHEGRLAHAYLFCGPRGTGKTSTARILAKMVNCVNGPTAEPCDECEQCNRIREGSHLDVIEIDAASHGGVEDARELRERAPTAPAQGREKVYIIDEAQRLSREAFDALLKVFEEPPPGVRFVLATTEPHKMPPTIVGRCQRFDFRRVSGETLAAHLTKVAEAEGFALTPEAAEAVTRHSEGSVRDALSLLDQAAVLGSGKIDGDAVASLVGSDDLDGRFEIADAVASGEARAVFDVVNRLVQEGRDIRNVTSQAIAHFRDLFLALVAPDQMDLLDVAPEHHARLVGQSGKFTTASLDRTLQVLLEANTNLRWTTSPRLTLELALVKAAVPETDASPEAVLSRVERLERLAGLGAGSETSLRGAAAAPAPQASPRPTPAPPAPPPVGGPADEQPKQPKKPSPSPSPEAVAESSASAPVDEPIVVAHVPSTGAVDADLVRRTWPEVVKALDVPGSKAIHAVAQFVVTSNYEGGTLELVFPAGKKFAADKIESKASVLQGVLRDVLGITPKIRCIVRDGPPRPAEPVIDDEDDPVPTAEQAVERAVELLGAEVVED